MLDADGTHAALALAVARALGPEGPVARAHAGYVVREGQLGLGKAIAQAIADQACLIAEAGTGTGKTFAYLVPAVLSGGRVLISTGTRNLQDQLFTRDLPEIVQTLGVRVQIALLKGRSNYVCPYHLSRNLSEGRFARREDIADLKRIERFAAVTDSGDRAELPGVGEEAPAWQMATSTRENCLGADCPDVSRCFVIKARQAAQRADVIVVNHHLLCADLALRDEGVSELLPTADTLIFDEAHQLPEVATQFFGQSVSVRQLTDLARDILRAGMAEARDAADWTTISRELEQSVRELRLQAGQPGRLDAGAVRARPALLDALEDSAAAFEAAGKPLEEAAARGPELQRCALRITQIVQSIRGWVASVGDGTDPGSEPVAAGAGEPVAHTAAGGVDAVGVADSSVGETVTWVEVHAGGLTLHATPLSVARVFRRHRDERPRAWVFLSATLAVGGDLRHFSRAVGIGDARELIWPSPFDFQSQGLLYVPAGLGEPSGADFPGRVFQACWPLVLANRGRCFVLCTTLRMVDQLAARMRDAIAAESPGLQLLVQGTASRAELITQFRRADAPVLVGSASFWEGVDVPGNQLSLVIIDKLPFAPPDEPVLRARIDAARRAGEDPFRTLQLSAAAMALKQGAGRLIRSERDQGVLMVCDVRLADKSYGRTLLKSLPPFARTRSAQEALEFIERVHAGAGQSEADPAII